MPKRSARPMPVLVACALGAVGLLLLLAGLSMKAQSLVGAALTSGGIGTVMTAGMLAVAGHLRR